MQSTTQIEWLGDVSTATPDGPLGVACEERGAVALVAVRGPMTEPILWAMTYAVAVAEDDPTIRRIVLAIDSDVGEPGGLAECVQLLRSCRKLDHARVLHAVGGAFLVACACPRVYGHSRHALLGGILRRTADGLSVADLEVVELVAELRPRIIRPRTLHRLIRGATYTGEMAEAAGLCDGLLTDQDFNRWERSRW